LAALTRRAIAWPIAPGPTTTTTSPRRVSFMVVSPLGVRGCRRLLRGQHDNYTKLKQGTSAMLATPQDQRLRVLVGVRASGVEAWHGAEAS
jgi:hypothetical protein